VTECLRTIEFVDEVPATPFGKVLRRDLRSRHADHLAGVTI
jgi:acyl-coenzyme A synthetase/AMP-(fatty) acid ligase